MPTCTYCNRDLDEIAQDNMSHSIRSVICEDCIDTAQTRHDGCPDDCSKCGDCCVYDH
jgi:hypothetical protein